MKGAHWVWSACLLAACGPARGCEPDRAGVADAGPAAPVEPRRLAVPSTSAPLEIDGELDEADWRSAARTGPFVDEHEAPQTPYSEARLLRDDQAIYLALYAADEDIRARPGQPVDVTRDDAFVVSLTPARSGATTFEFVFTPDGAVAASTRPPGRGTPAEVTARVDRDGTLNDPSDDDEEWVVEARIPLAAIGLGARDDVRIEISRCDEPRRSPRRCGHTGAFIATR